MRRLLERYPVTLSTIAVFLVAACICIVVGRILLAIPFWAYVLVFGYLVYRRYRREPK